MAYDPLPLAQDLIRRASVTPADAGAMDVLQAALESLDFTCRRMRFGEIENLYARRGKEGPNLCFAGNWCEYAQNTRVLSHARQY